MKPNATSLRSFSYPLASALVFVVFQLLSFPLMVASAGLQLDALYRVTALQSIVLTAGVNYLISGQAVPGTIFDWMFFGLLLHTFTGWLCGSLLANRLTQLGEWTRLLGSLLLFEMVLSGFVIIVHRADLLRLAGGW